MIKPLFAALLAVLLSAPAFAADSGEDAFNAAVSDINEAVKSVAAAQARRSQAPKAELRGAAPKCSPAQADAAYAAVPRCEAALRKAFGVSVRDVNGALVTGFSRSGFSLVLLTTTDAFFYHEDCDICAAVERCSLKDGALSTFKTAHSVDCADLAPFTKAGVVYSACK